jgi:hypothetical protein
MSIFDIFSCDEIDSLIGKVLNTDKTAYTNRAQSQIKDNSIEAEIDE